MGQFEKIVVLTVLSLIAVILVISFSTDEVDPLAGIDGSGERTQLAADPAVDPAPAPRLLPGRQRSLPAPSPEDLDVRDPFDGRVGGDEAELRWPDEAELEPRVEPQPERAATNDDQEVLGGESLLLSATIGQPPAPAPARDPRLPASSALLSLKGLEDTFDPELKLYTWRRGDSFEGLAQRFYGDVALATLLRRHNEDRDSVPVGESILVPVHDRRDAAPERLSAGRTHLVQDGESLWSIATKAYGRGNDWQRIFEANRDRLTSPDAVRAGMELRLP